MRSFSFVDRTGSLAWVMAGLLLAGWAAETSAQTVLWIRHVGTSSFDYTRHAASDGSSVYVVGSTNGTLPTQTSAGGADAFVRKYDATNGNVGWISQFGTAGGDDAYEVAINSTGIYVTGGVSGPLEGKPYAGDSDVFLRKYDASGTHQWTELYGTPGTDIGRAVAADSTGVYVAGYTGGSPALGPSVGADIFVRKYDANGTVLWTSIFGSAGGDSIRNIAADASGIYVTGWVNGALPDQTSSGGADAFVRKYDAAGTVLWTHQFGPASGTWLALHSTGAYLAGSISGTLPGETSSGGLDSFLRKYDKKNGTVLWTQQFGSAGDDNATGVEVALGSLYITGITNGSFPGHTNAGNSDAYLARFDTAGNSLGALQIGTSSQDDVFGTAADATGIYLLGLTAGTLPGQTALGSADGFVIRLAAAPPNPSVFSGGVVNNASFKPSPAKVAPGSITAIFGNSLNDGSEILFSRFEAGRLVTTLGGATVEFNGIPAPMFYSTAGQVGVQVPFELAGQGSTSVHVKVGDITSPPATVLLDSVEPGIFTQNQAGTGIAAVLHQDGVTPVTEGNPARREEVAVFYATGLGALNPPLATGAPSIGNTTAAPATVTIDGLPATVEFSGSAPGFVGLNQINVRIPSTARFGADIPVILTINGKPSNTVTIPIAP